MDVNSTRDLGSLQEGTDVVSFKFTLNGCQRMVVPADCLIFTGRHRYALVSSSRQQFLDMPDYVGDNLLCISIEHPSMISEEKGVFGSRITGAFATFDHDDIV